MVQNVVDDLPTADAHNFASAFCLLPSAFCLLPFAFPFSLVPFPLSLFACPFPSGGTQSAMSVPDRFKTREKITNMLSRVPFRPLVTTLLVTGAVSVVHIPDVRATRAHGRITGIVHLVALTGT